MKRSILGVLIVLTCVAVGIAAAPPLTFTFTDVVAKKGALETDSYAVNNAGAIAGDWVDSAGIQHGMVLAGKKLTSYDYKKCTGGGIAAYGINKAGDSTGWCLNGSGIPIGFTRSAAGKFADVNFPKGAGTEPTGINDTGAIVGLYFDSTGIQHGFSKVGKKYTSIDVKGESTAAAWGINNKGQITVYSVNSAGDFDSFLKTGTKFKKVNDPKAKGTLGTVVHTPNNKGDIDGTYYDSSGNTHGWLLHAGKYYDVNDSPTLTRADGLNDNLEMVGRYTPSTGGNIGFKCITKK